jgi:RNA polymerase-binding protein DksA
MPTKAATTTTTKATAKKKAPAKKKSTARKNAKRPSTTEFRNFEPYKPKRGEDLHERAQREHFTNILRKWKAELMEEVDRTVTHMKDEAANFPDPADRATQEEEFSLELRTRDRERKLIKKIDSDHRAHRAGRLRLLRRLRRRDRHQAPRGTSDGDAVHRLQDPRRNQGKAGTGLRPRHGVTRAPGYRGRFAPSPTGPLHFGSLLAAVASYLDARHRRRRLAAAHRRPRPTREVAGAGDRIVRTLEQVVLRRRDGLHAYALAVVVDDRDQDISHVIRGRDLLEQTFVQRELFACLGATPPAYGHCPVLTDPEGNKLSKQTGATAIDDDRPLDNLRHALTLLGQDSADLDTDSVHDLLACAAQSWTREMPGSGESLVYAGTRPS